MPDGQPIRLPFFLCEYILSKRSIVYIDGLNFYYGLVKDTLWKWLNIEEYFKRIRQDDDIQKIKYFTAVIVGSLDQQTYLSALYTLPLIQIIPGRFKNVRIKCRVPGCRYTGDRLFIKPEEKRTDVNIAIHMLNDACSDACDRLILVSGDSDLAPALEMVKLLAPEKQLTVNIPSPSKRHIRAAAPEIRAFANKHKALFPNKLIEESQFPNVVIDANGDPIKKPSTW